MGTLSIKITVKPNVLAYSPSCKMKCLKLNYSLCNYFQKNNCFLKVQIIKENGST